MPETWSAGSYRGTFHPKRQRAFCVEPAAEPEPSPQYFLTETAKTKLQSGKHALAKKEPNHVHATMQMALGYPVF